MVLNTSLVLDMSDADSRDRPSSGTSVSQRSPTETKKQSRAKNLRAVVQTIQLGLRIKDDAVAMRRVSTIPEVSGGHYGSRRASSVAYRHGRKSSGAIFRDSEKVVQTSHLLSMAVKEEIQRRNLMDKFRFMIRFRLLLHRWWKMHNATEVSQTHPFYMQYQMINDLSVENTGTDNAVDFKASYFKANKQMRMSHEAVRILSMDPKDRTEEEVYYAMIALRGINSIADYPIRMQKALASHGMFQSFGPKRFIVKQGHPPSNFYFILYGTVVVATLDTGDQYAKTRVTLRRGENFGELAIAHRIPRQSTVLTMEYTEFLTIDCDTYENIFMSGGVKTIHDPDHNKFMQSLFFFKEWPIEKLQTTPKAIEFCYFRRNMVMVRDSNLSEWIYIVKSGSLHVYKKLRKCYHKVNKRTGNFRQCAHTDGFMSFLRDQTEYNRYAMYNNLQLPPALAPDSDSDDEYPHEHRSQHQYGDEKENLLSLPLMKRVEKLIRPRTAIGGVIATYGHASKRNIRSAKSEGSMPKKIDVKFNGRPNTPRTISAFSNVTEDKVTESSETTDGQSGKRTLLDDYEGSGQKELEERPGSVLFMNADTPTIINASPTLTSQNENVTSAMTPKSKGVSSMAFGAIRHDIFVTQMKGPPCAADKDPEFVLVQTLTKGQAFGLQHMFIENQPSLIVVSGGAECIMVSRKFYKEHVNANVVQRLKQQLSPYPSDEDLQNNLQIRVNWMEYKKITIQQLMNTYNSGKLSQTQRGYGKQFKH